MDNIEEKILKSMKEALPFMSRDKKHELLGLVEAIPDARRAFEEAAKAAQTDAVKTDERKEG